MPSTIFYSWQSDLPNSCNRGLIETALQNAIKEIAKDTELTLDVVLDRDTQGLPGSPDISEAIFAKIDTAAMFVADVSIVVSGEPPTPNPNVLVELGYAAKALGWHRILMVVNTAYGAVELLPFDLRSRRITPYSLKDDAPEKAPARNGLAKTFRTAIGLVLNQHAAAEKAVPAQAAGRLGEGDRMLFQSFLDELPSSGSIRFIDEFNMAGFSFPSSALGQLELFYRQWSDAEHEFVDVELERLRSELLRLAGNYLGLVAVNVFPASSTGNLTVPPEWELNDSERFFSVVSALHEAAAEVVAVHQELVRVGRSRLDVL
jgi:hypothetical protein